MYRSTTPARSCEQDPSEVTRDFARQLRVQAAVVEAVRERLSAAENIGWESPAGRNFRSYVVDRTSHLLATASLMREAAATVEGYGAALAIGEGMIGSRG